MLGVILAGNWEVSLPENCLSSVTEEHTGPILIAGKTRSGRTALLGNLKMRRRREHGGRPSVVGLVRSLLETKVQGTDKLFVWSFVRSANDLGRERGRVPHFFGARLA